VAARLPGSSYLRQLRERGLLLPIAVGLVVTVLLVHGFLLRRAEVDPDEPAQEAAPAPTSTPFRPDLEKVPLTYLSDYWLQLGERSSDLLVGLGEAQVTGVRVTPGYALGTIEAADAVRAAPGAAPEGQLVAADGRSGLALFRLVSDIGASPRPTAGALHAGAWLAAVAMDPERGLQVTPGHLVSVPPAGARWIDAAIPFPASYDMAAVVDLDSQLVGVAFRGPRGIRVLSAEAAADTVDRLVSSPACRAVDVSPIPDSVREALHLKEGVVIEMVATDAFTTPPDLLGGDVLLQLDGTRITSPEEFAEAWDSQEPGSRVRLLVSRGGRRLVRRAEMPGRDCRPEGMAPREMPLLGAVVQWTRSSPPATVAGPGFRFLHVPPGSPAMEAGFAVGDVLVAVDGNPLTWPEARGLLDPAWSRGQIPVFTVRRGETVRLCTPPESEEE
jgi:S1-C subfamily serine protease